MDTKKLRQKILDLAIHGKLVPQDPNDKPASVLLERIRAEKEQLIREGKIKAPKKSKTAGDTSHYGKEGPWELPEGWVWCRIDEMVCAITDGDHQPPPQSSLGVPFLVISDVNTGKIIFEKARFVPISYYNNLPLIRKACIGDILFTVTGSYGIVIPVTTERPFCFQRHIGLIKTIQCSEWISLVLQSGYVKNYCDACATGTAQKTVSLGSLRNLIIPVPPEQEQNRILHKVGVLCSMVDEISESLFEVNNSIQLSRTRVLDLAIRGKLVPQDPSDEPAIELLKRINPAFKPSDNLHYEGAIPNGWLLLTYNDVADYINGRAFKPEEWESEGLPIIRIQNLNEPRAPYNYSNSSFEKQYRVQKGDLLFAWAASLGVYIWDGKDAWLNQHIFKVIPFPFIDKEYLFFALSASISDFYQKSHGSGMVHITRKQFVNMPIFLPPINEQKRIIKAIKAYYNLLDEMVTGLN